jgi:nucleoside-diphosphate-sugar epimerase
MIRLGAIPVSPYFPDLLMSAKRVFVTGASGCIGHYVVEALIQQTNHDLFLLLRHPEKLKLNLEARPGIHVIQGGMADIDQHRELLATMQVGVLIATAWGGTEEVFHTNLTQTLKLMEMLGQSAEQIIYFATASILGRDNQLLPEALEHGSDYIRSKYLCFEKLKQLAIAEKVTTLFPTLLLGGNATKPISHVTSGIPLVVQWINLVKWLKVDGSFHYIHSQDVATMVQHLIDHPPAPGQPRDLVLGNARTTVDEAIACVCTYLNTRQFFRLPLTQALADFIIKVFRIQMADWDRFSMEYRHFTHARVVSPADFGLPVYCRTFTDVLKVSGIPPRPAP